MRPQPKQLGAGLVYQPSPVSIKTATPASVFAGAGSQRTFAPTSAPTSTDLGALTPGRSGLLLGGGIFSVPTANTVTAQITMMLGSAQLVDVTTPAAPVGTNAGIDFHAAFTVQPNGTTIIVTGVFAFVVLGSTAPVFVPFNSVTAKTFDPTVLNLLDMLGSWNSATLNGQVCTVQTASLIMTA